ncbi:hypothetical protein L210DRAFT_3721180 [Boletus edulis BED1]|uniref:Fungal-type protein kinase domain-containing protein n=1 Tax=Boletus edulis BED1 TaxID=1328754 RepID=A0AAD4G587_BOLED|nr:hypothetical protein L210DRAFT_3721180 [Boletus edulis BED1]
MIIFRKLRPITELTRLDFLHAWWDSVLCHLALWKKQVYHRDISASNLMYRIDNGKIVGVLNDFDLASTQQSATGTECTGTVPSRHVVWSCLPMALGIHIDKQRPSCTGFKRTTCPENLHNARH